MRRKPLDHTAEPHTRLKGALGWPHLIALGIGAIVGTGIYTLIGQVAGLAGPAAMASFIIAGAVCACAALAYAEMATMMPAAGSAYAYSYHAVGEVFAWVVGWSLILEYTVVAAAVSVGWSGYAAGLLKGWGLALPPALTAGPAGGGLVNAPGVFIALAVTALLLAGVRESARVNFALVVVKLIGLGVFIALAAPAFQAAHFDPFAPFGWGAQTIEDKKYGVMAASAIIFFAFYGFDAVSTAAEETANPGRDMTIGIIGSMVVCTVLYLAVAATALGAEPARTFAASSEPLAAILRDLGHSRAAGLIGAVASIAMPTVILVFMYGQSRIFFAMARDGLIPRALGNVGPRGVPTAVTIFTGIVAAIAAGLFPLSFIVELANAGTLMAFIATAVSMLVLRRTAPDRARGFRCPAPWVVGPAAIGGCLYLFWSLSLITQELFLVWNAIGAAVYVLYARRASLVGKASAAPKL